MTKAWSEGDIARPQRKRRLTSGVVVAARAAAVLVAAAVVALPLAGVVFGWRGSLVDVESWAWDRGTGRGVLEARFEWDSIQPKENLQFQPCFDGFECAKLKLPLDYFNGTYPDSSISLALAKLPARVPIDDPRYGGPILINPGGPGGSGVKLALASARNLQVLVDAAESTDTSDASARYYDIIGFDPRGIGQTEPPAACIPDGPSRWSWRLRENGEGILDSSDAALGRLWSMSHAYGSFCKQSTDDQGPDIMEYMTTASVARDMLEVVERHSEYVASRLDQKPRRPERTLRQKDAPKLQYFGFSYGTYLGYTFASMFPDRVGRLILDGVVNADDYIMSLGNGSLHDTEKTMTSFYTFCVAADSHECPLRTATASVADIKARVEKILKNLYHNPLAVHTSSGPEIVTYSDVKQLLFTALYTPPVAFPIVAQLLFALEKGSGEALENWAAGWQTDHIYQCALNQTIPISNFDDAETAILCSDGVDVSDHDMATFEAYWRMMEDKSPTAGAIWAKLRMQCNSWKKRAVHRFEGPFGANTSNPILFISNTADNVTPLRSGRIMHSAFPGSGHLVQDSAGHCSVSYPTSCTISHIRNYFQEGKLPAPGTLCIPAPSPYSLNSTDPGSPFYEPSLGSASVSEQTFADVDEKALDAARQLQLFFARENSHWPLATRERGRISALMDSVRGTR